MLTEENVADLEDKTKGFYRHLYPSLKRLKPTTAPLTISRLPMAQSEDLEHRVSTEDQIQALIIITHSTGLLISSTNIPPVDGENALLGLLPNSLELFNKILNQLPLRTYQYCTVSFSPLDPKALSDINEKIKSFPHLKWIFAFGATASSWIWSDPQALAKYQGKILEQNNLNPGGSPRQIRTCCFFHPDMLVLNSQLKQVTWTTLLMLQKELKLP